MVFRPSIQRILYRNRCQVGQGSPSVSAKIADTSGMRRWTYNVENGRSAFQSSSKGSRVSDNVGQGFIKTVRLGDYL